ncbi:MAG: hypothetical protein MHM6MM_004318 [Cercozoa sp. M6MM]
MMETLQRLWQRLLRAFVPCCADVVVGASADYDCDLIVPLAQRGAQVQCEIDSIPVELELFVQQDDVEPVEKVKEEEVKEEDEEVKEEDVKEEEEEKVKGVREVVEEEDLKEEEEQEETTEQVLMSTFTAVVDGREITLYYNAETIEALNEFLRVEIQRIKVENLWRSLHRWQREHHWNAVVFESVKFVDF